MIILADVVWPALFLEGRLFTWWIILAGLVIELIFVRRLTRASASRAALMTIVANAISTGVGIVGVPFSGFVWEIIADFTYMPLLGWGTFNPVSWLVSCALAALLNALIETASLRLFFKVAWTKRLYLWLAVANSITVAMAMTSIMISPPSA